MRSTGTAPGDAHDSEMPSRAGLSVYLHPGQVFASAERATVTTVLGSCVSVCLFDPSTQLGGINHYLLPYWTGNGTSSPRFGNVAMETLFDRILALGAWKGNLTAKVFGGACVLGGFQQRPRHLGEQNVDRALAFLRTAGVPVVAQDTGGQRGRKLVFRTGNGEAWLKAL